DPVAVMAAFTAILTKYPVLQAVDLSSSPLAPLPFTGYLTSLPPATKIRIRLVRPNGSPYGGQHLTGLNAVSPAAGIYELTAASVGLDAVSGSFTQDDHDRLVCGPATSGRLMSGFTPPTLPVGIT